MERQKKNKSSKLDTRESTNLVLSLSPFADKESRGESDWE